MRMIAAIVLGLLTMQPVLAAEESLPQVELEAHFVQFRADDIRDLARSGTVRLEDLQKLRAEGKSELLHPPLRVITESGGDALVRAVTEHVYPTDFTVDRIRDVSITNETSWIEPRVGEYGMRPSGYEMREVGAILEAVPEVAKDRRTIKISLTPRLVYETEPNVFVGKYLDSRGKETEVKLVQPVFRVFETRTRLVVADGATTVFGSLQNVAGNQVLYLFLTARIVDQLDKPTKKD